MLRANGSNSTHLVPVRDVARVCAGVRAYALRRGVRLTLRVHVTGEHLTRCAPGSREPQVRCARLHEPRVCADAPRPSLRGAHKRVYVEAGRGARFTDWRARRRWAHRPRPGICTRRASVCASVPPLLACLTALPAQAHAQCDPAVRRSFPMRKHFYVSK